MPPRRKGRLAGVLAAGAEALGGHVAALAVQNAEAEARRVAHSIGPGVGAVVDAVADPDSAIEDAARAVGRYVRQRTEGHMDTNEQHELQSRTTKRARDIQDYVEVRRRVRGRMLINLNNDTASEAEEEAKDLARAMDQAEGKAGVPASGPPEEVNTYTPNHDPDKAEATDASGTEIDTVMTDASGESSVTEVDTPMSSQSISASQALLAVQMALRRYRRARSTRVRGRYRRALYARRRPTFRRRRRWY